MKNLQNYKLAKFVAGTFASVIVIVNSVTFKQ